MRHAAHKATNGTVRRNGSNGAGGLFTAARGSHSYRSVRTMQMVEGGGAVLGLEPAVAQKLNEIAPMTRRSIREAAKAAERRNFIMGSASLAALAGTAATAVAFASPDDVDMPLADDPTTTTQIQHVAAASRSDARTPLEDTTAESSTAADTTTDRTATSVDDSRTQQTTNNGSWTLGADSTELDSKLMSRSLANNENVAKLMDQDADLLPAGFDPNHATGDVGLAYEFSQCTWWAYTRRQQLGLPVGSHFGNGAQWAASAKALGYWVDNTPRHVGDIMVFRTGQEGASAVYGHVAIVESINPDGSVTTSECGSSLQGRTVSRTFTNVSDFQYIHY
ncbi:CHAP domain-containing protein [Bifidobacterium sp. CP2]|uniref:CHAP domain-containing protein n=1 Tax=Bifidobacterium sp. CP2 TaxID=2809025 RepID=UPI001BDCDC4D|nr:CHAP domain-containing protein [Bifidobacterium sp. CP2]MBT1181583.1 CHAP domain-containing protein [Bifidobacterium sp. CP2]